MLGLFVHWLELSHAHEVNHCLLILFDRFIGKTSAEVSLDEHVNIVNVERSINDLGTEFDLLLILLIFTITESDVAENCSFHLCDFFLEYSEVLHRNIKNFSSIFVKFDCLCIGAFFEFKLRLFFGSVDFSLNPVELRLKLGFLLVVDGRLRALDRRLRSCSRLRSSSWLVWSDT